MTHAMQEQDQAAQIERLLQDVAAFPDPADRATTEQLVQALLNMYGEGLNRLLELTTEAGAVGYNLIETFAQDELVGALFLLHDLHPVALETRVVQALDEVRPYLKTHGGSVELISVEDGIASVRLIGSCQGCPSSAVTLKGLIEEAVFKAAPDLKEIRAEEIPEAPPPVTFIQLQRRKDKDLVCPTVPAGTR